MGQRIPKGVVRIARCGRVGPIDKRPKTLQTLE